VRNICNSQRTDNDIANIVMRTGLVFRFLLAKAARGLKPDIADVVSSDLPMRCSLNQTKEQRKSQQMVLELDRRASRKGSRIKTGMPRIATRPIQPFTRLDEVGKAVTIQV